jgi:hypothetical protein
MKTDDGICLKVTRASRPYKGLLPWRDARALPAIICVHLCLSVVPFLVLGCTGKPNQANIELRNKNQELEGKVAELQRAREADAATIRALQDQRGTFPSLPQDRLERLYTPHGIKLGRLTGGADLDPTRSGEEGLKVYVVPTDQTGDELKAAGSFVVELFDLNKTSDNLVGRWEFNHDQARQSWLGSALLYEYVLTCLWQRPPEHSELTLKVTFQDELTGRQFATQKVVHVRLQ